MRSTTYLLAGVVVFSGLLLDARQEVSKPSDRAVQNWTHRVRIAGHGLGRRPAADIVRDAADSHVFGIEVDNDITGRYESFLDPDAKLTAIRDLASEAHKAGNRAFVYIAGTECITKDADSTPHTLAKDHPDWLQRKRNGEPAIFTGGAAFWIRKGDEDVWISPYAKAWREQYMTRVRQIAATGIDGIYVDIPYWMTHFEGWQDSWASFDDYTVEAFRRKTGLDARRDVDVGNFADPHFRQWIDFRIETITEFMREIDLNAKGVNPAIMTIPEIYPGIERAAVVVGADVYQLYGVTDAIAHEYSPGAGNHMASKRTPLDWFRYQVGMRSFRAFAQGKASWILNYSWDGDARIAPPEPMMNLAMSVVMTGSNFWDAATHVMSGSNDLPTRRRIFSWIERHDATLYSPRSPIRPIGVYFSPATRNYFPQDFMRSYQGIVILLMQLHREFEIVTPRTLGTFRGSSLILPDVRVLDPAERAALTDLASRGVRVIVTGTDATALPDSSAVQRFPQCPGNAYLAALEKDFQTTTPATVAGFVAAVPEDPAIRIEASPKVATEIARVDGKLHVFFANFDGLVGGENAVQTPQKGIRISLDDAGPSTNVGPRADVGPRTDVGPSFSSGKALFLPFLGDEVELQGRRENGRLVFVLPDVEKGAIVRVESP